MGKVTKWEATEGLLSALEGINGASGGYHTDLGARVYPREVLPDEHPTHPLPYVTVNQLPMTYSAEGAWIQHVITWIIFGVVVDGDGGFSDVTAQRAIDLLHDDIVLALTTDLTLGGKVRDLEIVGSDTTPPFEGVQIIEMQVAASQIRDVDDLGP